MERGDKMYHTIDMKLDTYQVLFDCDHNSYHINNKKVNITEAHIDHIIRIIRNWDNIYINNDIIDDTHNYITIKYNNQVYKYLFKNKYPHNFHSLVDYISQLYEQSL